MKLYEDPVVFREYAENMESIEALQHLLQFSEVKDSSEDVANKLLDHFGSLKNVLEAMPAQLMAVPGIGKATAGLISTILPFYRIWEKESMKSRTEISSLTDAQRYCLSLLAGKRVECFYVVALDAQNKLLGTRLISEGSLTEVNAYPRKIVETALNYNAYAVLLCHNHPGGSNNPSAADIENTKKLQSLMYDIGIRLLDHFVVSNNEAYSMTLHGDIRIKREPSFLNKAV